MLRRKQTVGITFLSDQHIFPLNTKGTEELVGPPEALACIVHSVEVHRRFRLLHSFFLRGDQRHIMS